MLATPNLRLLQVGKQSLKRLNNPPEFGSGSDSHYLRRNAAQEDLHKSQRTSSQSSLGVALGRDGTMGFAGVGVEVSVCLTAPLLSSSRCFLYVGICTKGWAGHYPFRRWGLPSQALISGGFLEVGAA